jgi:hypothetical protein
VEKLKRDPRQVSGCHAMVMSGAFVPKAPVDSDSVRPFPATYTKLNKLPKEALRDYIPTWEAKFGSPGYLAKLESSGSKSQGLQQLMVLALGVSLSTKWPPQHHDRAVVELGMRLMYQGLGRRLAHVRVLDVDGEPRVNLEADGCYMLLPEDAPTKVVHRFSGEEAGLGDLKIRAGHFSILNNHDEMQAMVVVGKIRQCLADFYEDGIKKKFASANASENVKHYFSVAKTQVGDAKKMESKNDIKSEPGAAVQQQAAQREQGEATTGEELVAKAEPVEPDAPLPTPMHLAMAVG